MTAHARSLTLLTLLLLARPAFAQPGPEPGPIELGQQGLGQFETGNWQDSYDLFKRADGLSHSPVFQLYMARSLKNMGKLLEARATYERLAKEQLPADAPTPWTQAQLDAKAELAALKTKVPAFTLTVKGTKAGDTPRATLDGAPIQLDTLIEADPGEHLMAAASGNRTIQKPVKLGEGVRDLVVTLDFQVERKDAAPPPRETEGSIVPGVIVLSAGAAGLIGGAITGGLALAATSELDYLCGGDRSDCRSSDPTLVADKASEATTLADASTGLLIAGGVLVATGIVLMIVRPGGESEPPPKAGAMIAPTWGGLAISGWF
ncbi:MAG: hypothetical protein JNK04_20970 [Myxococcales bacterium]|nr:hypothetical protein [Myxococcales bacterium]